MLCKITKLRWQWQKYASLWCYSRQMILRSFCGGGDWADDVDFNTDFYNMCLSVPRLCYLFLLWRLRGSYVRQSAVIG